MNLFEKIYNKYASEICQYAFWLSGDMDNAKDITSEAFLRIWTTKNRIMEKSVKGLLIVTARNIFLQNVRKSKKMEKLNDDYHDNNVRPDEIALVKDELALALKLLNGFPEIDRSAIILKAELGLSYLEIARCLRISETAAKVKVHRIRRKLKETIQEG